MAKMDDSRPAYVAKTEAELTSLAKQGARVCGNAFSPLLLLKGQPNVEERSGADPLSGADGAALRAATTSLGYAPEEWCAALTVDAAGKPLSAVLLRELICALDPGTIVTADNAAAAALREAYAEEFAALSSFEQAMLTAGYVVHVLGLRVLNLGGFEAALDNPHEKQRMWAYLKQIPPLGEPY